MDVSDFQLNPGEQKELQGCSKNFRLALWKAGEHVCLTTYPDCCRETAIKLRNYYKELTMSPANKIPYLDETQAERSQTYLKQYFKKK